MNDWAENNLVDDGEENRCERERYSEDGGHDDGEKRPLTAFKSKGRAHRQPVRRQMKLSAADIATWVA